MTQSMERAIHIVNYCLESIPEKADFHSFQHTSYSRWAATELLDRLYHSDQPPLVVIEEFRDLMDEYSCVNPSTSYIFSTAKGMTEWIIDLLIS